MIDVKDDYLPEVIIHDLEYCMLGNNFAWFLQDDYFVHNFWKNNDFSNRYNDICRAWMDMYIKPSALIGVKGTLYKKSQRLKSYKINSKYKKSHTSVLYINNNNGCTKFEDGTIIESIRNRIITFPANLNYAETNCKDEDFRCVITINYYKEAK